MEGHSHVIDDPRTFSRRFVFCIRVPRPNLDKQLLEHVFWRIPRSNCEQALGKPYLLLGEQILHFEDIIRACTFSLRNSGTLFIILAKDETSCEPIVLAFDNFIFDPSRLIRKVVLDDKVLFRRFKTIKAIQSTNVTRERDEDRICACFFYNDGIQPSHLLRQRKVRKRPHLSAPRGPKHSPMEVHVESNLLMSSQTLRRR